MAGSNLDELFNQIIKSEKHAQERKTHLLETKQKIKEAQQKLIELVNENYMLRKEFMLKVRELTETQVNLSFHEKKQTILFSKKKILHDEKSKSQENIVKLKKCVQETREQFCTDTAVFMSKYGLQSHGRVERAREAQAKSSQLMEEKQLLEKKRQTYDELKGRIDLLLMEIDMKKQEISSLKCKSDEMTEELVILKEKTEQKSQEKEVLQDLPSKDPEFLRLHKELEASKSENLEERCFHLQQEIQNLQQKVWQKQMQGRGKLDVPLDVKAKPKQSLKPKQRSPPKANRMCVSNFSQPTENIGQNSNKENETGYSQEELKDLFLAEMDTSLL